MRTDRCLCDGRYDGCEHPSPCVASVTDSRWGPWCRDCNPRRMAHISARFDEMLAPADRGGDDDG